MEGDGVAYMVMGEGGETGQATQVVAVDNGDGTQQLVSTRAMWIDKILNKDMKQAVWNNYFWQAIPVMDPETGQETYMIIDPQVFWQKMKKKHDSSSHLVKN